MRNVLRYLVVGFLVCAFRIQKYTLGYFLVTKSPSRFNLLEFLAKKLPSPSNELFLWVNQSKNQWNILKVKTKSDLGSYQTIDLENLIQCIKVHFNQTTVNLSTIYSIYCWISQSINQNVAVHHLISQPKFTIFL